MDTEHILWGQQGRVILDPALVRLFSKYNVHTLAIYFRWVIVEVEKVQRRAIRTVRNAGVSPIGNG